MVGGKNVGKNTTTLAYAYQQWRSPTGFTVSSTNLARPDSIADEQTFLRAHLNHSSHAFFQRTCAMEREWEKNDNPIDTNPPTLRRLA